MGRTPGSKNKKQKRRSEKLLVAKDENATLGVSETTLNSIDNIPITRKHNFFI